MIIGFTGTRQGLTPKQVKDLKQFIIKSEPYKVIHGDCIGADKEFNDLARESLINVEIEIWPSNINKLRAWCKGDIIHEPKDPLERNKDIVTHSDILIACPKELEEVLRSGTWSTIRYARKLCRKIIIIEPY